MERQQEPPSVFCWVSCLVSSSSASRSAWSLVESAARSGLRFGSRAIADVDLELVDRPAIADGAGRGLIREGQMETQVRVEERGARTVLARRIPVRLAEIGKAISGAFADVYGHLGVHGVEPAGPPFVIYEEAPSREQPFDIDVCAPVPGATEAPAGWRLQEIPAGRVATLLHLGAYDTIGSAYETLSAWIGSHGLAVAGPPREFYLSPPGTPPEQVQTVIEFPVAEVTTPARAR
jgi:effector-binding domain-containing protein